jgi:hypothetical protein
VTSREYWQRLQGIPAEPVSCQEIDRVV